MLPHHHFYMLAFAHLSTCRQVGAAVGPIPWTAIVDYADRSDMSGELAEAFVEVIREMDAGYMKWVDQQEKQKRETAQGGV